MTAAGRALVNGDSDKHDGLMTYPSKRMKKQDNISLLEHTRLRNIGNHRTIDNHVHKIYFDLNI